MASAEERKQSARERRVQVQENGGCGGTESGQGWAQVLKVERSTVNP